MYQVFFQKKKRMPYKKRGKAATIEYGIRAGLINDTACIHRIRSGLSC